MSSVHLASSSLPVLVTPSDTALLTYVNSEGATVKGACRAILLEVAGDLAVKDSNNTTVVIPGLAAGILHPISTQQILSTGTGATGITAFF